jgi:DNA-binding GntR family transcriptional regulator
MKPDTPRVQVYGRIAADLRDRIVSGEYQRRQRLPTEIELTRRYKVSRVTVRRALRVLQEERLISRRQGSGTFVNPQPSRRIPVMIDYTGSMRDHAPRLERKVLLWKWIAATKWVADTLETTEGDLVLYAERVDEQNGTPVAWDRAYIARSFGDGLDERHLGHVDFVEVWTRTSGFQLESCQQFIEADTASPRACAVLKMKPKQAVLRSTEIYYTYKSRPAGVFVSHYHPAYIWISSRFRWSHGQHDHRGRPTSPSPA